LPSAACAHRSWRRCGPWSYREPSCSVATLIFVCTRFRTASWIVRYELAGSVDKVRATQACDPPPRGCATGLPFSRVVRPVQPLAINAPPRSRMCGCPGCNARTGGNPARAAGNASAASLVSEANVYLSESG
jgi:hypothetical protein